jgi:hypothetical protein
MITNQTPRRPEHLHSKRCASAALIAAIENLRDLENFSDLEFRLAIQANDPKEMADGYLADGLISCQCPPCFCCPA